MEHRFQDMHGEWWTLSASGDSLESPGIVDAERALAGKRSERISDRTAVILEALRLAELAQYHEGRSFDNAALGYQWMRSHDALLALLQQHAPAALLTAKLRPTPSPEGTEALERLVERERKLREALKFFRDLVQESDGVSAAFGEVHRWEDFPELPDLDALIKEE